MMDLRELAREIQSVDKGFRAEWMGEQEWRELVYGKGINSKKEFEEYCKKMSGEVKVYKLGEVSKKVS
jgi:hypothetical protein